MEPTLRPGDRVWVEEGAYAFAPPEPGALVLARHPFERRWIIKRVLRLEPGDRVFLVGDNPACSTDSRSFGSLSRAALRGKVTGLADA